MAGVLNVKEGANIVANIINAIASGYREDIILDELAQAIENKQVTKEQFNSAIEGLELYAARFANSVKSIADAMGQFEFNDALPILKNKQLNLAQQVMQDIEGFNSATKEYDESTPEPDEEIDDVNGINSKEAEEEKKENAIKQSYKDYFLSKLKEFNVDNPKDLTSSQWEQINEGWQG